LEVLQGKEKKEKIYEIKVGDMSHNIDDVRWQHLLIMACTSTGH